MQQLRADLARLTTVHGQTDIVRGQLCALPHPNRARTESAPLARTRGVVASEVQRYCVQKICFISLVNHSHVSYVLT